MAFEESRGIDVGLYVDIASTMTLVAGLRNVELTINGETIDASHAGNYGWRKKLAGLLDWSVSASAVILMEVDSGGFDGAMAEIRTHQRNRNPLTVRVFYPEGTYDEGEAIVTQWQISAPYDGVAEGNVQLEGAGQLNVTAGSGTT